MTAKILDITKHPRFKIYEPDIDWDSQRVEALRILQQAKMDHAEDAARYSIGPYQQFKIDPVYWGILYD